MRWNLIGLVASRLLLRKGQPPALSVRMFWVCAGLTLVCTAAVAVGATSLLLVSVLAASSLLGVAALCVRLFPTSMAVSIMGIALSCASLMTVLGVTTGFERELTRSVARVNGHLLLTKYGLDFFEYNDIADRWITDPDVVAVSPFAFSMVAVVKTAPPPPPGTPVEELPALPADEAGERGPSVVVSKGLDPQRVATMEGFSATLERGDPNALRPGDSAHRPGVLLGYRLAQELDVEVGEFVRIVVPAEIDGSPESASDGGRAPRHSVFEVLDLMRTGTSEIDRNLALMHLSSGQALFFRERRVTGIEFQLTDPELADAVAERIEASLGYPYRVSTWRQTNASVLTALVQVRAAVSLILGLMVLVSASSLVASLLLIVRSKRHDIAVVLALGGERDLVFWLFESVGLVAGLVGAALGVALGGFYCAVISAYEYPLVGDVYPVDHLPVVLGLFDVLAPVVAAVGLCALASGPVAMLAARTRLLTALSR